LNKRFESEALGPRHDVSQLDSGQPILDAWLREFAGHADAKRQGRTYVWHAGDFAVVAYFNLSAHVIQRAELPSRYARSDPEQVPALLLGRLALDRRLQGKGLGSELLFDALSRAVDASNKVGGRYIVVEAVDDSAGAFYEHHGFRVCPSGSLTRYVRKVSDIEASLRAEGRAEPPFPPTTP